MEAATFEGTERCRCCMASGAPGKDLSDQYDWMGEKEVYADMLLESFDITLSRTAGASWSICDACVARLRDSANFKKQVLHTERSLLQQLISTSIDAEIQLKVEGVKSESVGSDNDDAPEFESHFYEDDDELKDVPVKIEAGASTSNTEMSNDEDLPLSALSGTKRKAPGAKPVQVKRPKLTVKSVKTTAKTTVKATAKAKVATKPVANANAKVALAASKVAAANKLSAQSLLSKLSARPIKITVKSSKPGVAKKGNLIGEGRKPAPSLSSVPAITISNDSVASSGSNPSLHFPTAFERYKDKMSKSNAAALLKHSTVTPFKWSLNYGFRCFYCDLPFKTVAALRKHTSEHSSDKARAFISHMQPETPVKIDITSLVCKVCSEEFKQVDEIHTHLSKVHKVHFYPDVNCGILPFRLTDDGQQCCVLCEGIYQTFYMLHHHVTKHYLNYICSDCGEGFISFRMLHHHQKRHNEGFPCRTCGKTFQSYAVRKTHIQNVHETEKYKCPHCPEKFSEIPKRRTHLIKAHGATHLMEQCEHCGKTFARKRQMVLHINRTHLKKRDHRCEVCNRVFFSKTELSVHMTSHKGERPYECDVCGKAFIRRKTLQFHIRMHNNDKRYVCSACPKAFVQYTSLKLHIKGHHPELVGSTIREKSQAS